MKRYYCYLLWGFAAFWVMQSCKKEAGGCSISTVAVAQVQFGQLSIKDSSASIGGFPFDTVYYYYNDTILPYINAVNLEVDTIGILGIPNTGYFTFYLNPNGNMTSYAIRYDTMGLYPDTIRIYHTSSPYFVSNDCGYTHFFKIDSLKYISEDIDSVFINNYEITLDKTINARMAYFYFFKDL